MASSDVKSFDAFKTKVKACPLIGICFFKGFYRGAGPAGFEGVQNPVPLPPPVVDHDLERLNWPERVAEVSRYGVLCAEYWLSQRGTLWEWLRLNLWAAIVITVAAILLIPPVTAVLKGAAEWTALLGEILENVSAAIIGLPPLVVGLATLLLLLRIGQRY